MWSTLKLSKVLLSAFIFIRWPGLENIFQFLALAIDLQGAVNPSGLMIILPLYALLLQEELGIYFLLPCLVLSAVGGREGYGVVPSLSSHSIYTFYPSVWFIQTFFFFFFLSMKTLKLFSLWTENLNRYYYYF